MKFASVKQSLVLIAVTCLGLYLLDYYKNPQLWHPRSVVMASTDKGPRLTLWMNHLCCSGCLDDIRKALAGVGGVDLTNAVAPKSLLSQAEANAMAKSLPDFGNPVELPITDLDKLDLVAIDKALRDKGFVAGRMELGGVQHFRLEAVLDHLCCGMCDRSINERIAFLKAKGQGGQLKWLDSVVVEHEKKTVVAHARFVEPGKSVDVAEFLSGLNYLGYEPSSLRVAVPANEHMHGAQTTAELVSP
jgi:copper chaperone CopZ